LNLANWHNHQLPQQFLGSTGTQFTGLSELAIATLPVMLFFHEEERKLQDKLQQVVATLNPQASQAGVLAVGYAIAQALKEKFTPFSLLPQTIGYLQASQLDVTLPAASTSTLPLVEQLLQVQTLLEQGVGLERTLISLLPSEAAPTADLAIALAFYCCLSTPEDFQLAVLRAARTGYQLPITCALTGALSGAYNSTAGIPVDCRISLDPGREILPLAAQLLATWSGVYQPTNFSSNASQVPTVAAPRVIRLR
jgi:ADP-ribosylglycohydrolase